MCACSTCKHKKLIGSMCGCDGVYSERCYRPAKPKPTNADRIRSMSNEELVDFLCIENCNYCVFWNEKLEHCTDQRSKKKPETQGCAEGHRLWLQQPAEEG